MKVGTIEKILIKCDDLAAFRDSLKFGDEKLTCSRAIQDLLEVLIMDGITEYQLDKVFDHANANAHRWTFELKCAELHLRNEAEKNAEKATA